MPSDGCCFLGRAGLQYQKYQQTTSVLSFPSVSTPNLPPAVGLVCVVGCFPSHALINHIFSFCFHLSLSILSVTSNIFPLIPFLTFFPPQPSRRHREICISLLTERDWGTVKITPDTRKGEQHHRPALFDIYAGVPYIAPVAKHCSPASQIPLVIRAIQLTFSKLSLHTSSKMGDISAPTLHPFPTPQQRN